MTWNILILWLSAGYLLYYLLNIAYDLARAPRQRTARQEEELTFSEDHQPQMVGPAGQPARAAPVPAHPKPAAADLEKALPVSGLGFSGGVSLSELFSLFKADALQATRAIPY